MEVTGRIKLIGHIQDISSSFRKREVVVTTEEQYPQHIMIEFTQDKVNLLDSYQVGEQVRVSINLRGREWQSPQGEVRYFNTIQGWRIEHMMPAQQGGNMGQNQQPYMGQQDNMQSQYGNAGMQQQANQQQGFAQNNQAQQQGGFNQNQQQGFVQNNQAQQAGGFNQNQQFNQQQGFAQNNQVQQQGGFNQNQQGFNQGQSNMGQQFPPASSYMEEDHDDLPF
ncbi:hypothetical protein AV926_05855 [Myroides marinus]|uniref:DUF3127 domain-containing protein n=1 Tax=Myroides marinus TaxID=703342 RepID=A0A161SBF0_9FLAO|nr:DUF3127 domain-containing protein [Myroides marinus]KZE83069.1 hypothetical protein AV926_05855 [Myroides marinus]